MAKVTKFESQNLKKNKMTKSRIKNFKYDENNRLYLDGDWSKKELRDIGNFLVYGPLVPDNPFTEEGEKVMDYLFECIAVVESRLGIEPGSPNSYLR